MRNLLLASTMLAAGLLPGVAMAQQGNGLEEVTVTAQRTTQDFQKAGLAMDTVSADQLVEHGISTAAGLQSLVPSLTVQENGGPSNIYFVRGVGNFTVNGYSDPAIAFNYDDVYLGRPTSTAGMFYDLQRVEVLKGPQGTLYGRNATGGAINVLPNLPKLGEFSGNVTASYGNYNAATVEGAVNIPLGDKVALRASGNIVNRDGYLSDGTSDEVNQAGRLQLLADLTPDLTVRVAADYSHTGGKGPGSSYAGNFAFNPFAGGYTFVPSGLSHGTGLFSPASQAYRQTLYAGLPGRTLTPLQTGIYENNDYYGTEGHIEWRTSAGTLTVIPAWRHAKLDNIFAVPAFYGYSQEADDQTSLEARWSGERISIFDYLIGAYYFDKSVDGNYTFAQQALNAYQTFKADTTSYALFGRVTANITDDFRLIGGLRWTKDDKRFNGVANVLIDQCTVTVRGFPSCPTVPLLPLTDLPDQLPLPFVVPPPGQARPVGATGAILINAPTPVNTTLGKYYDTYHLGAEYDVAPRSLLYLSYDTGYRSGGFALSAGHETFQPEYIDAYTLGMKNRFFDNRLQLNIEAFLWKYRNLQVNHTGIDANGNQGQFTDNVGKSTNQGVEISAQALATENTLLTADVQYLDASYDSFVYNQPNIGLPPITGCPYSPNAGNPGLYDINCSGKPSYLSPKWTINLGVQQIFPIGDYQLVAEADTQYKSSRYVGFEYLSYEHVNANWQSNAQLILQDADARWSVAAYVRNIEDERTVQSAVFYNVGSTGTVVTSAPRTYGVRVNWKF